MEQASNELTYDNIITDAMKENRELRKIIMEC